MSNLTLTCQQLIVRLRQRIATGDWAVGAILPDQVTLMQEYHVTAGILQCALTELLADGLLSMQEDHGRQVMVVPTAWDDGFGIPLFPTTDMPAARKPVLPPDCTVGVIYTAFTDQAFDATQRYYCSWPCGILRAFTTELTRYGGQVQAVNLAGTGGTLAEAIAALRAAGVLALTYIGIYDSAGYRQQAIQELSQAGLPVVYIGNMPLTESVPHVFYDQRHAGQVAARHLLRQGFRRLVLMAPFMEDWVEERIAGARLALQHAGLPADDLRIYTPKQATPRTHGDEHWLMFNKTMMQIMAQAIVDGMLYTSPGADYAPPGIIAANDFVAMSIHERAAAAGYQAGRDYGLISFDDSPLAHAAGITSLRHPLETMGEEAARILYRTLTDQGDTTQVRTYPDVIPRPSSQHPHAPARTAIPIMSDGIFP